jgi:hypothetical protein
MNGSSCSNHISDDEHKRTANSISGGSRHKALQVCSTPVLKHLTTVINSQTEAGEFTKELSRPDACFGIDHAGQLGGTSYGRHISLEVRFTDYTQYLSRPGAPDGCNLMILSNRVSPGSNTCRLQAIWRSLSYMLCPLDGSAVFTFFQMTYTGSEDGAD